MYHIQSKNPVERLTWINSCPWITKIVQPTNLTTQLCSGYLSVRQAKAVNSNRTCSLSSHKISFWSCTNDKNFSCQLCSLLGTPMWQQGCTTVTVFIITKMTPLVLAAVRIYGGPTYALSAEQPFCKINCAPMLRDKKCRNMFVYC